jgi:hypothetical protein
VKSHFESSMTDMFSAALKVMRVSYDLWWIALVITTGIGALACNHVALRLILRMWRAWRRSKRGVPHEADRSAQAGIVGTTPKAVRMAPHHAVRDKTP